MQFAETQPLSTYLVAFVAGNFKIETAVRGKRTFHCGVQRQRTRGGDLRDRRSRQEQRDGARGAQHGSLSVTWLVRRIPSITKESNSLCNLHELTRF